MPYPPEDPEPAASVEQDIPDLTRIVKVHSVLPNSVQTLSLVPFTEGPDGTPHLPFVTIGEAAFLRTTDGEHISLAFVHRIEGLPDTGPVTE